MSKPFYKMDLNNPPVLSEEQKARLEALAKRQTVK
jgi:hypothetical protein